MDPYVMEELTAAMVGLVTSIVPSSLLGIATYVLSSLGLYTLASRRGIGNAWLSWVPVLNIWIIGSLSDQYQYVVKGKVKSKRKSLLILNIVNMLIALIMVGICIFMVVDLVTSSIYGGGSGDKFHLWCPRGRTALCGHGLSVCCYRSAVSYGRRGCGNCGAAVYGSV